MDSFISHPLFDLLKHVCTSPPPLFKWWHRDPECTPPCPRNQTRNIDLRPRVGRCYLHLPFQRLSTCLNVHTDGHVYCLTATVSGRPAPCPRLPLSGSALVTGVHSSEPVWRINSCRHRVICHPTEPTSRNAHTFTFWFGYDSCTHLTRAHTHTRRQTTYTEQSRAGQFITGYNPSQCTRKNKSSTFCISNPLFKPPLTFQFLHLKPLSAIRVRVRVHSLTQYFIGFYSLLTDYTLYFFC